MARIVGVISLATGAILDWAIAPYAGKGTGENALLRQCLPTFKAGDIVLGDCYYASFFLVATFIKMGIDVVFPQHASRHCDFRKGKRLGKKEHLVEWRKPVRPEWLDEADYADFPDKIVVREVSIKKELAGFQTKSRVIVTTFLDPSKVTKNDLSVLYDCRWFVEISFLAIKETMKMDVLRCKTPEMVHKEIGAHLLAYNLVRQIMVKSAIKHGKNPREMSFKLALQCIFSFTQVGVFSVNNSDIYEKMLKAIASKKVGNRAGRSEPRRVKRRPKAFPRLQKERHLYRKKGVA